MDALSSLLCLLTGTALPTGAAFLLVRRATRQLAVSETYGSVSRELGLDVDTRGLSLRGHLGEQRLWVGEVMVGYGPDRRTMCWGVLDLERPLGLGLLLRRRGISDRLFRRPRGPRVQLPNDPLERFVEIHGDEPDRVLALLDPTVREVLLATLRRWRDVVVTDTSVRIHLPHPLSRAEELRELVTTLRSLATALHAARRAVPPPSPLVARADGWQRLADALGLQFEPSFPGVAGELDGRPVRVTPIRSADGYCAELRLGFREHRRTGLRLRPQEEAPDGYWSVGQDIQFGDEAFDRAFVVKGWDPDYVRDLLSPPVRQGLLALHTLGRLDLDDLRLHLGGLALDPARLEPLLVQASRSADALEW
ncbi:MAG: hypothetical protein KC621_32875 [Myxococcales bacterium]|nr:hypothetical protein [Myxococcales bacterium]